MDNECNRRPNCNGDDYDLANCYASKTNNKGDKKMNELEKHFEEGWDNGVQYYERTHGKNFWTELYWYAFKFATDGDYDGGVCFKMRQDAVEHLNREGEKR